MTRGAPSSVGKRMTGSTACHIGDFELLPVREPSIRRLDHPDRQPVDPEVGRGYPYTNNEWYVSAFIVGLRCRQHSYRDRRPQHDSERRPAYLCEPTLN